MYLSSRVENEYSYTLDVVFIERTGRGLRFLALFER